MKRAFHPKALTLLISGLLVCLLVFWAQAQAKKTSTPKPTPTPTPEKKITIEDTVLRREGDNKITFKPEFEVARKAGNIAEVRKKSGGTTSQPNTVIVGEVECHCTPIKANGGGGGCTMTAGSSPFSVICVADGNCKCKMSLKTKITS